MARQGRDSQFGMVDEVTYGTPVTVTKFLEIKSGDIELQTEDIVSEGMRAGRLNQARSGAYTRWKKGAAGALEFDVMNKGFGLLLKHCMGAIATTGPVDTTAYTHTASQATLTGDFFTCQLSRGTQPHTYHGCKVTEWELSTEVGELLGLSVSVDAEEEDTSTSLATASYPATQTPFSFIDAAVTVGGASTNITSFSIGNANNLATERYNLGSAKKREQLDQGRAITGNIEMEYEDQTMYNRYVNATEAAVVVTFTGALIAGTSNFKLIVNCPAVRFDGSTPSVDGPDIISMSVPFTVLEDSMTIAYTTTDVTP